MWRCWTMTPKRAGIRMEPADAAASCIPMSVCELAVPTKQGEWWIMQGKMGPHPTPMSISALNGRRDEPEGRSKRTEDTADSTIPHRMSGRSPKRSDMNPEIILPDIMPMKNNMLHRVAVTMSIPRASIRKELAQSPIEVSMEV